WPGLGKKALYDNRDLAPTIDTRSVLKTVMAEHLGVTESALETTVFPDSDNAPFLDNMIRRSS
ncbi:MAG: hypothetical protein AAF438_07645, partial [Pseudomonadota bacterium]